MDSIALWIEDSDDDTNRERVQRILLKDKLDIMNLNDKSFVKHFRLNKPAFLYVLQHIRGELLEGSTSAHTPLLKLATTLRFLALSDQHQIGQYQHLRIYQQSMFSCVTQVCNAIEKLVCRKHIIFKSSEENQKEIKRYFYNNYGIPGVAGVVDGIHIRIKEPSENQFIFFNRRSQCCLNVMMICDHQMFIRFIHAKDGATWCDSNIWIMSAIRDYLVNVYQKGDRCTRILGDCRYPLEPWLLTPYRGARPNSTEFKFNEQHAKARSVIDKTFDLLKSRFRCLTVELPFEPVTCVTVINVCVALHNICLKFNVDQFPIESNNVEPGCKNIRNIGKNIRNDIKDNMPKIKKLRK
ncbi:putative nuclease HARBI1 [Calliphora vicina]|uniref:putative nuclease HARBI1 n=1 Tax=Calliphora vicina TaxID=7373 RepID=UPI00325BE44A